MGNSHGCSWFLLKHEKDKNVKLKPDILVNKKYKEIFFITAEETKSQSRFHSSVGVHVYKPGLKSKEMIQLQNQDSESKKKFL